MQYTVFGVLTSCNLGIVAYELLAITQIFNNEEEQCKNLPDGVRPPFAAMDTLSTGRLD
jgi:hypothetical protein